MEVPVYSPEIVYLLMELSWLRYMLNAGINLRLT